jgi:hypothetical protein
MYSLKNNGKMIFEKKIEIKIKIHKNKKNRINYHSPKIIKEN